MQTRIVTTIIQNYRGRKVFGYEKKQLTFQDFLIEYCEKMRINVLYIQNIHRK